jgi:hypothetical protein
MLFGRYVASPKLLHTVPPHSFLHQRGHTNQAASSWCSGRHRLMALLSSTLMDLSTTTSGRPRIWRRLGPNYSSSKKSKGKHIVYIWVCNIKNSYSHKKFTNSEVLQPHY